MPQLEGSRLLKDFEAKRKGDTHEQMSCVVILDKLYDKLSDAGWENDTKKGSENGYVDFDLIIRSIIGMPFSEEEAARDIEYKKKNIIIELINSHIFDMDKLDYIMRDAHSTGIGTPQIDTQRLFRNMYIRSEPDFTLVFLHRAVPALQNMVESRDALYMYVYNHHATIFSDFIYSYIFRRMAHSAETFLRLVKASIPKEKADKWNGKGEEKKDEQDRKEGGNPKNLDMALRKFLRHHPGIHLGIVPKPYLFSPNALLDQKRSDSDLICLLHDTHYDLSLYFDPTQKAIEHRPLDWDNISKEMQDKVSNMIQGERDNVLKKFEFCTDTEIPLDDLKHLFADISRVYTLIDKYNRREFLKPWWKTPFEFIIFMKRNFPGDLSKKLSEWICNDEKKIPRGDEFRSQLAKHVIYISQSLMSGYPDAGLLMELQDGDFFVIQRQIRFYDEDAR